MPEGKPFGQRVVKYLFAVQIDGKDLWEYTIDELNQILREARWLSPAQKEIIDEAITCKIEGGEGGEE